MDSQQELPGRDMNQRSTIDLQLWLDHLWIWITLNYFRFLAWSEIRPQIDRCAKPLHCKLLPDHAKMSLRVTVGYEPDGSPSLRDRKLHLQVGFTRCGYSLASSQMIICGRSLHKIGGGICISADYFNCLMFLCFFFFHAWECECCFILRCFEQKKKNVAD